jgi:hypothetical protein
MPKRIHLPSSIKRDKIKKRTSIGNSVRSRPKNKYKKRTWKKYRGQGK